MKKVFIYMSLFFLVGSQVQSQNSLVTASVEDEMTKEVKTATIYGTASYYSNKFHGRRTASGEIFSQQKLTAACNVLPLGTWIRVTNLTNNRTVLVKVNDRLHHRMKRAIDLSREAAKQLGFIRSGLAKVRVEVLGKKRPAPQGEY
jgi:rare lipoprotein A